MVVNVCPICRHPLAKLGRRGYYMCDNSLCPRYNQFGTYKQIHEGTGIFRSQ